MAAKSTLSLAALCCALAIACPRPTGAQTLDGLGAATSPSLAAATLPARSARVSCTGCLSRPSSAHAVVVDTSRTGKDGKTSDTGNATLQMPGFALDSEGNRLDLALRLEMTAGGLEDGGVVMDFSGPDPAAILLGNPLGTEKTAFTVTMRLLKAGCDLEAQSDLELGIERIAPSKDGSPTAIPVDRRAAGETAPATFTWSGGGVFRIAVTDPYAPGASDGDDSSHPDGPEVEDEASQEQDRTQKSADDNQGVDADMAAGGIAEADDRKGRDGGSEDPGKEGAGSVSKEEPATDPVAEDPRAVDADALDTDRDCCTALVALDAPQELAAADYPVTSATSRRIGSLSLPKQFPLTYLPSGEIVAPTLLRVLGATTGWMDVKDISIRNRATDAKVRLSARKADGTLEEWYDGETFLLGWRRIQIMEDVDFVVTLEGFSHETDGDLIEASVYDAQPLFTLAFTYDPNFPPSGSTA